MIFATSSATVIVAAASFALLPIVAQAHGDAAGAAPTKAAISTEVHSFGVEGDPKKASRTIVVSMDDSMHYSQPLIRVAQGETVTFALSNKGKLLHEFVIGTERQLQEHAELMRKNPSMEHEESYMAHVKPGAKGSMTWKFTNAGTFQFGCLVVGHFEAGMKGVIVVAADKSKEK